VRLEIGAGARAHDGFVAYDLNPEHADIVGDALTLPFADQTVTEIRAVDVLEHLSWRVTDLALVEWARVCTQGAPLYVQVPDAQMIFEWYTTRDPRLTRIDKKAPVPLIVGANWRLMGGHADGRYVADGDDFRYNAHYSLWDSEYLAVSLECAGFEVKSIVTNAHPNLLARAVRR
jgi:hypothetical protein